MCYDLVANTKQEIEYALLRGDIHLAEELEKQIQEWELTKEYKAYYHVLGYTYPKILTFTNLNPYTPQLFTWGLVPSWVTSKAQADKAKRFTLNSQSEKMFTTRSFKDAALKKRCLIYVDGFYEHHTLNGDKYPFLIQLKSKEPMIMAGLWDEWKDRETGKTLHSFSIVTTQANELLGKIHNEPAGSDTLRMPVILSKERQDEWLKEIDPQSELDKQMLLNLCIPSDQEFIAHPVHKIRGKAASPNSPEALAEVKYDQLTFIC